VKGKFSRRLFFDELDCPFRSDESFRKRQQIEHHKEETTILEQLPIDMVHDFFLDPMHVLYLGVMKKLLKFWVDGAPIKFRNTISLTELPRTREFDELDPQEFHFVKLNSDKIFEVDARINKMSNQLPRDFARKPRSIKH
jgi:hypothetical protein